MTSQNLEFNFPIYKYAIYEISMTTTTSGPQFNFPVNMYLNGRNIYAIEAYINSDMDRSPVSTGNVTWDITQMRAASLTLNTYDGTRPVGQNGVPDGGTADWIKQMPCTMLHRGFNTDTTKPGQSVNSRLLLAGLIVDWSKSYIQFTQNQTFTANTSALFGVYYK